ncbi:chromosomal replication initiator protein DnaA [Stenotrophobium rhamnosiphilum]|uniref:Chromosomal replication initiator protein DnaA n=1 Tax=Stenotrophobium rhamnosiphilum TaxID=2029166 RepID=A0A2T5MFQ2_9GAMM|nr:chromosomal replication initiator protein DnaA [Stenotrophobium rhamnosiphilum]PTU31379.1 chromosomal replication initiator protein DnaA [Stenotrophobium rhamnosiphilum]
MYTEDIWTQCVRWLEGELPDKDINTWIRPLHPVASRERLLLLAPNRIVLDRVKADFLAPIRRAVKASAGDEAPEVELAVGAAEQARAPDPEPTAPRKMSAPVSTSSIDEVPAAFTANLNPQFTLENFIEGKSNAHARAAAQHVVETPGAAYNPLLIYGQSGLGKTHLMHSVGNAVMRRTGRARIAYLGAEQWMNHMVMAIRHGRADEFRSFFRSVDALLIDDIQFFANKERTQEEFFHTFNALIDNRKQIVLTCDRYPKDVDGIDERLKSRFTWGLSVAVEPPELETRVAILLAKAEQNKVRLPEDVAFFVAQRIRSNVRDLEGALATLSATARLRGEPLTVEFARSTLKDRLAAYERMVTMDNIKRTVSTYYNIRLTDLSSPRRTRSLARPRQIAMALSKELTQHSLPEIGEAFGKDHTTVLHACRKVAELRHEDLKIREDYENLLRQLGY